jgi:hypothetical protein
MAKWVIFVDGVNHYYLNQYLFAAHHCEFESPCPFVFSCHNHPHDYCLPEICTVCLGSMTPEFGLTQYRFGAVVLILKQTLRSDGLDSFIADDTGEVNGP